jgi:plasmid stability protein
MHRRSRDIVLDIKRGGDQRMASIIVRGLDDSVKEQLAAQARSHGRSMEAEVRDILTKAATRPHIGLALARAARQAGGADDLTISERSDSARAVVFD